MSTVILRVPADPSFVQILRSHVSSVGAGSGFTIDAIDDLRLAVDEAAACLLDHAGAGSTFTLEISPKRDALELFLLVDTAVDRWPPIHIESELSWKVLTGLGCVVSFESVGGEPAIRMTKSSGV